MNATFGIWIFANKAFSIPINIVIFIEIIRNQKLHVCTCLYMYVHVCTCMYMYMYVHVCTCTCMYM